MSDPAPGTVASRTLRGIAWAYGSYMGERVVVLITTAVLARLLVPAEFGRVALALVFITLLETLADLGLSQSLVVAPDDELDERADTAWLAGVGLGVGAFALLAALAPALAAAFDQDDLHGVLTVRTRRSSTTPRAACSSTTSPTT
jgi:PST family polysaccharide transporter